MREPDKQMYLREGHGYLAHALRCLTLAGLPRDETKMLETMMDIAQHEHAETIQHFYQVQR